MTKVILLIAINVLVFIAVTYDPNITILLYNSHNKTISHKEFYRLLTYAFTHSSLLHLFFNMYMIRVIYRLDPYALDAYLYFAVMAGLGGVMLQAEPSIGASGAVLGCLSYVITNKILRYPKMLFNGRVLLVLAYILICALLPFGSIDITTHACGIIAGIVLSVVKFYR